jgi:hypothetical protein
MCHCRAVFFVFNLQICIRGLLYYVKKFISIIASFTVTVSLGIAVSSADQVTLRNGDILNGKVLAMTSDTLVLQDASLGDLTLPRAKVSNITFGAVALPFTNSVQTSSNLTSPANSASNLEAMFHEIRQNSNLVQQVEAQVLGSSASPEAVNKFNELLDGLSTGQMDMNGLRAEAQSAADQLQDYKKEMGPDAGEEVDGYLSVLNNFLRETAPTNGASP